MNDLEKRFHKAMINVIESSKLEVNYNPTYFSRMVAEYGGVGAAKRLLSSDQMTTGFTTLYLANRLDLTVEAHVIKPVFASLFSEEERTHARRVLEEHQYNFMDAKPD